MTRAASILFASAMLVSPIACGDVYAEPDGTPDPAPTIDGTFVSPESPPVICPGKRPRDNTACSEVGAICEYGDSPDGQCNRTFACTPDTHGTAWLERPKDRCFAGMCPADPGDIATLDGQPCALPVSDAPSPSDADEVLCPMTDGICACTTGPDAAHALSRRWVCIKPSVRECPVRRPLTGSACGGELWCDYGSCKFKRGVLMQCKDSVWIAGGATCG